MLQDHLAGVPNGDAYAVALVDELQELVRGSQVPVEVLEQLDIDRYVEALWN